MTAMDFRLYDNILGRFFGMDALSEKNHYLSTYQFGDGNPVVFSDPTGLDSMPGWIRDLWDATTNGYNSTWTNNGSGGFEMTRFWGSGQPVNSIDAGPSSGGGSGGGSFGDGYFGLPSFGVGTVYNYNTGAFTKPSGSVYYNFGNGLWTNTIMLDEVIVTGSLGKLNFPMAEIINRIETAQAKFNRANAGGGDGGFQFYYTSHGLNMAGGLLKGFETLTYSDKGWLGLNGKIYNSHTGKGPNRWTGSRGGAKAASNSYKKAGNGAIALSVIIGGIQTWKGYQKDGNSFGYNAQHAMASSALGIIGGYVGGQIGVSVGGLSTAWAGGVPGAAIGGVVGGIAGSYGGSWLGGFIVDSIHNQ